MSSDALPISPARFALAIQDLPLSTLHLKAAEIRNSIAHLDYSNEELKPFAEGKNEGGNGEIDLDCVEAIKENEAVIERMMERLGLLRSEVERRGQVWVEGGFDGKEEEGSGEAGTVDGDVNGQERSSAWTDGTFTTGRIVNGEVQMDNSSSNTAPANTTTNGTGGRLDDEALRRAMEERMREDAEDNEGGMHL